MSRRLSREFFTRPALTVARELLGKVLVREHPEGARKGRIVEVEAYVGEHDLACHASRGRTARTEVLFHRGGVAYVYLIYGMYHCFNVVTGPEGHGEAVLVRGVEPLLGIPSSLRTDGPGRLSRALGITRADTKLDLRGDLLYLEPGEDVPNREVKRGPRVGIDYAGAWVKKLYRLWVRDNRFVSKPR